MERIYINYILVIDDDLIWVMLLCFLCLFNLISIFKINFNIFRCLAKFIIRKYILCKVRFLERSDLRLFNLFVSLLFLVNKVYLLFRRL